ncbi:HC-toxin efflux carrier TOXA 15 [Stagonosporopsis vannaccii]|nr:HC-toxin efflux carrier TOXA 15 [Stagonosporopsis vannaccii]
MDQKKSNMNDASRSNYPSAMELPRPMILRNEQNAMTNISPSPAESDFDSSSWPSRRTSGQHQREATDSVLSLLTPATKARASQLREVQSASDEAESPYIEPRERPPRDPGCDEIQAYPSLAKTVLIMILLYVSIFLVALDRTILGPAIPSITNHFDSITDIGWYSSAYMLTSCGFILLYGRLYTFFPTKPVFLSGIFLFEIGSAICGAAQSSIMLILGRAIAGLGSSGVFTGAILIMLNTVPLHKRPLLQGLFGACFGVASVTGPLLGGAFTESGLTWRWCFYINIPLGGITVVVVMFLLRMKENKPERKDWRDTVKRMDPLGTMLFLPSITCLLLALEWGAAEYAWSSPQIITLLTIFAVLFMAFVIWQFITRNTTATLPARIVTQRSIVCGCASQFCVGAAMLTVSIYMPLWFQAIKSVSPFQSGANSLPLVLSTVVSSIVSGGLIQRIGYYTPFMIIGSCCLAVGSGLLSTLAVKTGSANWIGYLILFGVGVGFSMQHANLAVQVILQKHDIPIATAMLSFCQTFGGAIFTAVGQNLYINKFSTGLERIEGIDVGHVLHSGATDLTRSVAPEFREIVLEAYNHALTHGTFLAVLFVACLAVPAALGMEWRTVKKVPRKMQGPTAQDLETGTDRKRGPVIDTILQRRTSPTDAIKPCDDHPISTPTPAWRKRYRSSGQFSQWMTVKLNPDLRAELEAKK